MGYKDNSKPWFETGDFPTQLQFYQVFDWLRWKDEPLSIADITNLTDILNGIATPVESFVTTGATFEYIIPVGFIMEKAVLKPFANCSPNMDIEDPDTANTFNVLLPSDSSTIIKPSGKSFTIDEPALINTRKIKIYGLPSGSIVYLIKRKLT